MSDFSQMKQQSLRKPPKIREQQVPKTAETKELHTRAEPEVGVRPAQVVTQPDRSKPAQSGTAGNEVPAKESEKILLHF
jgi:hypothetical protein